MNIKNGNKLRLEIYNILGKHPGTMNDRKYIDLIPFDSINDPIWAFNNLSDIF